MRASRSSEDESTTRLIPQATTKATKTVQTDARAAQQPLGLVHASERSARQLLQNVSILCRHTSIELKHTEANPEHPDNAASYCTPDMKFWTYCTKKNSNRTYCISSPAPTGEKEGMGGTLGQFPCVLNHHEYAKWLKTSPMP